MEQIKRTSRKGGNAVALAEVLSYLPQKIAGGVSYYEKAGQQIEEIRIFRDAPVLLVAKGKNIQSGITCSYEEFDQIFLAFCAQSVYAHAETIRQGYVTSPDGFRVGLCGDAVVSDGKITNLRSVTAMNVRVAHSHRGVSLPIYSALAEENFCESVLVYSPPGVGKTTCLRDLAILLAAPPHQKRVCVVDSRRELSSDRCFSKTCVNLLSGYPKKEGIEIAVRTLSPEYIICDEIGNEEDADAILRLCHAGVAICASAHAKDVTELLQREAFATFFEKKVFDYYCGIALENGIRKLHLQRQEALC
jgi:stage III sporulation protein AA